MSRLSIRLNCGEDLTLSVPEGSFEWMHNKIDREFISSLLDQMQAFVLTAPKPPAEPNKEGQAQIAPDAAP